MQDAPSNAGRLSALASGQARARQRRVSLRWEWGGGIMAVRGNARSVFGLGALRSGVSPRAIGLAAAAAAGTILAGQPSPASAQNACLYATGPGQPILIDGNAAGRPGNFACGRNTDASGGPGPGPTIGNSAFGTNANASGDGSENIALGHGNASGDGSTNVSVGLAQAAGDDSFNVGVGNADARGDGSRNFASGFGANATGAGSTNVALGRAAAGAGDNSSNIAIGDNARSSGNGAANVAIGTGTLAVSTNRDFAAVALGAGALAGTNQTFVPANNGATAIGSNAQAGATAPGQALATAVGSGATANTAFGLALGANANASAGGAIAIGTSARASGINSVALGGPTAFGVTATSATGDNATALGQGAQASAAGSVALGQGSIANRQNTVSVGSAGAERQIANVAAGTQGTDAVNLTQLNTAIAGVAAGANPALASSNQANAPAAAAGGQNATAIGYGASATADNSVALGNGSVANQANTVSVGAVGAERRIVNVADGTIAAGSHDAVNGGQVFSLIQQGNDTAANLTALGTTTAAALGGGATYSPATGVSAPSYAVQGGNYNNVGGALTALDNQVTTNTTNITALQNGQAGAFRDNNTSGAAAPQASGADAVAGGFGSVASAAQTVAIGHNAQATSAGATAVGYGSIASGDPTTAVGMMASATGNEASAFGASATASADNTTALGRSATASANNAVAVGAFSTAAQANSVAIGTNVSTTRANQIAIGNATQTYTLAGVSSAQSLAAQTGPTRFVTSDASGNLATSSFDPASVTALDGRVTALEAGYGQLRRDVRSAFAGTAIALALSGAVLPPGKNYALTGGFGTFRGQSAFGASGVARINDNLYASGGVGFATTGSSNVGARASLTYAW